MNSQTELDIFLNQAAQGICDPSSLVVTFAAFSEDEKRSALRRANLLAGQAGARDSDVPEAVIRSGVWPTRTAAVLLAKGRLDLQLAKISTLPAAELHDALKLAIALLAIADRRRRERHCAQGCTHWWHQDLRDEAFLSKIRDGSVG